MSAEEFVVFRDYPFVAGQKIRILESPRAGDWEVIGVSTRKVRLRCPVSGREVEWDRFCYFLEQRQGEWPQRV